MKVSEKLAWLPTFLGGVFLTSLLYYPGAYLTGDSAWQLHQAMFGDFTTHHPVIMAYVWHFLIRMIPGSGGIFLFHLAAFWLGAAWLIEERRPTPLARSLGVLIYTAYIPFSVAFFVIVKDTGMAAMLVLATGALLRYRHYRETWVFAVAIVAMTYAAHVRHGGFIALLPYFVWAGRLLSASHWKGATAAVALAILLPWPLYQHTVIKPAEGRESQIPMLYDIVAMSIAKNQSLVPEFYARGGPPFEINDLRPLYNPNYSFNTFWPLPSVKRPLGWVRDDREWTLLAGTWLAVIASNPVTYAAHRWRLTLRLLGINRPDNWPYWIPTDEEFASMHGWNLPVQKAITHAIFAHRGWPVFRAWFYLLGLMLMAGYAFRHTRHPDPAFLYVLISILINEVAICCTAVDPDFRFSFWAVFGCMILPLIPWRAASAPPVAPGAPPSEGYA